MGNWRNTTKIYLEYLLFIVGVYGPVAFTWLYSAILTMSPAYFGYVGTTLCWMVLYFFYKKL
ncbi:hypothetical protein [Brevibacillus centrosporus]|uniref:hypothetical protein n=1 Tax=Brevibacillus centrosporus TaxID=54910 RepID=UPI003987B039